MIPAIVTRSEALRQNNRTYFTGKPCARGHTAERRTANACCVICDNESQRLWYSKNKEKATNRFKLWKHEHPEIYKARRRKYRMQPDIRAREMLNASRWTAKKQKVLFDLDHDWILRRIEAGVCELTGIPFNLEPLDNGRQNPYTASLDRIIPERGYVRSNVRVILWALNAAFNSYGEHVYAKIAKVYLSKHGEGLS